MGALFPARSLPDAIASWDFSGAVEDMQVAFWLGCRVANAREMPGWNKGDEFEAARKKSLAEAK